MPREPLRSPPAVVGDPRRCPYSPQVHPTKGTHRGTIASYLDKVIRFTQMVDVPGGQVSAVNRRLDEDGSWTWVVGTSEGVSLDDPPVREAVQVAIGDQIDQFGTPFPW